MTRIKPINLEHLGTQRPEAALTAGGTPVAATSRRQWLSWAAWAALVAFIAWQQFGPIPTPGPGPNPIDAEGLHVLIVRDPSKTITAGQASVVNSVAVAEWSKANNAKFRRYDVADDLTKEDRVWREMRALVTDPPSMVTLRNKRANVGPIPDGIPAVTAQLERLK
jgi:hypothetical protein